MVTQEEYEERVIVFIDILGFREQIKKTVHDPEYFIKLRDILNFIEGLKKESYDNDNWENREITVFSDSIVISYSLSQVSAAFSLILDVVDIQLTMMEKGILMRGGITTGKLCHNDNIVYGPAMVEAYELETSAAIYPRVVVDKKVLETVRENEFLSIKEQEDMINFMLHQDRDGQLYVDSLSQYEVVDDYDIYLSALLTVKALIEEELSKQPKPSVRMKYEWIKDRFNTVVVDVLERPDLIIA